MGSITIGYPNIFETVKEQTDCVALAQELGLSPNRSGMIRCPDPSHEDVHPSCKVYHDGFVCFACGRRGSAIDLVMLCRGWDLVAATRWLGDRVGIPWPKKDEENKREYEKQMNRMQEIEKRLSYWAGNLEPEDKEYLKRRGFTEEFIKERGFGTCSQRMPKDLKAARELGLLIDTKDGRSWYMPHGRLVLPLFQYGKPAQVALHKPGGEPKYLYPAGWPKPLIRAYKRGEVPFLVEGVFDYFSLLQVGLPALASLGTQLSKEQREQLAHQVPGFIIAFDGDEAGQEAAWRLAKEFFPAARVIDLPEDRDVNDLLRELGPDKFKDFMVQAAGQAKDALDMSLARLREEPDNKSTRQDVLSLISRVPDEVERDLKVDELARTLKPLGVSKAAVRQEVKRHAEASGGGEGDETPTQAQILLSLAEEAEIFQTPEHEVWATFPVQGHKETGLVKQSAFKSWLRRRYHDLTCGKVPGNQALQDALSMLEAKARENAPVKQVFLRVAAHEGNVYLDMCNEPWQVIEVSPSGWRVMDDSPVKFRRARGMLPLPFPKRGGSIVDFRPFLNVDDDGWILVVSWLLAALNPHGPYPPLCFLAGEGRGKSTQTRMLRAFVDPAIAALRGVPQDERELAVAACNGWTLSFDNISYLPGWFSDALCRLSTGGGFSARELYSDSEQVLFDQKRPVIVGGITEVMSRPDLLDRTLLITLPEFPENGRKEEKLLWQEFDEAHPKIFGAILDAVSVGLSRWPDVRPGSLPRMADFVRWIMACEPALPWEEGEFLRAYAEAREDATSRAVTGDLVASAVQEYMQREPMFEGTMTELLAVLEACIPERAHKTKAWPKTPQGLSSRLRRAAASLERLGISCVFDIRQPGSGDRLVQIAPLDMNLLSQEVVPRDPF